MNAVDEKLSSFKSMTLEAIKQTEDKPVVKAEPVEPQPTLPSLVDDDNEIPRLQSGRQAVSIVTIPPEVAAAHSNDTALRPVHVTTTKKPVNVKRQPTKPPQKGVIVSERLSAGSSNSPLKRPLNGDERVPISILLQRLTKFSQTGRRTYDFGEHNSCLAAGVFLLGKRTTKRPPVKRHPPKSPRKGVNNYKKPPLRPLSIPLRRTAKRPPVKRHPPKSPRKGVNNYKKPPLRPLSIPLRRTKNRSPVKRQPPKSPRKRTTPKVTNRKGLPKKRLKPGNKRQPPGSRVDLIAP
ncbi:uncharacterized protein LOC124260602 [Haliotis rubra]|uniref:uncharacterized protein LOC124260602 n=1 Tax=Haliotis rubra TaxID=36100 RepID=UPI001EE52C95|nr:uncharacterized protein LOC124260602 [Haliotis rubra]